MDFFRSLKFFTAEDIERALPMAEAVEVAKEAFKQLSSRQVVAPPRTHLEIPEHGTTVLLMPSYLPGSKQIGLKLITLCAHNAERGLPLIFALVIVADATTGKPLAVMDGSRLTALRTGAASGAATDVLARKDARVAAIFGAGIQGRTQLEAVAAVRPIREAYVIDLNAEMAKKFALEMGNKLDLEVKVAGAAEALPRADVICTATTSSEPVFADRDLKPGVHINAIGSYKPHVREIPGETVARAKIVVDQREASLSEAGDLIIPLRQGLLEEGRVQVEIGEILAGLKPGRTSDSEVTFFKSVGHAVQDLAAAGSVLKKAKTREDACHTLGRLPHDLP
jgi:ornithine cyclodeaminase/alanine dehydrogenase-like protein (mu-crystallin family)